jgi:hypothetical protein
VTGTIGVNALIKEERRYEEYEYELRADGWYVNFNDELGFQKFAVKEASEQTVRQLIRKERSCLY